VRRISAALALTLALLTAHAQARPTMFSSDPVIASACSDGARMRRLCEASRDDPARFAHTVLGDSGFWSKQREVCESVVRYGTTLVPAGNSVGKSYVAARIVLWFLLTRPDSVVFTTGPSQGQLLKILWGEIREAIARSRIPLGIEPRGHAPVALALDHRWYAIGHVSNKIENATGMHREHLLVLVDEGSGVAEQAYEAAWSLSPSRIVVFGNPLHPHGRFHELCRKAEEEREDPGRDTNLIRIPSTSSPHIDLERSTVGLADRGFLVRNRRDYGEGSIWWLSHVLAQFPDVTTETLVPPDWADLAARTLHAKGGHARTAIDIAGGEGGDNHVVLTRDDNGLLDLRWSRDWSAEQLAVQVRESTSTHHVHPARVSFDKGGVGWDFGARLAAVGLGDARPYFGGKKVKKGINLRSAASRELRYRLDPLRTVTTPGGLIVKQPPFSFRPDRPEWYREIRPDLVGILRFLKGDDYHLELSADMRDRLKRSPDFADALIQSFAFPG
jgi:hypothetical protein